MKLETLLNEIRISGLWKCVSCGGGPCYCTGEFPHVCIHDGREWLENTTYDEKHDKLIPGKKKLVWKKVRVRGLNPREASDSHNW
jgi:hypothetical protein